MYTHPTHPHSTAVLGRLLLPCTRAIAAQSARRRSQTASGNALTQGIIFQAPFEAHKAPNTLPKLQTTGLRWGQITGSSDAHSREHGGLPGQAEALLTRAVVQVVRRCLELGAASARFVSGTMEDTAFAQHVVREAQASLGMSAACSAQCRHLPLALLFATCRNNWERWGKTGKTLP